MDYIDQIDIKLWFDDHRNFYLGFVNVMNEEVFSGSILYFTESDNGDARSLWNPLFLGVRETPIIFNIIYWFQRNRVI